MTRLLILGGLGAALGAAMATFGLNVGLVLFAPLSPPATFLSPFLHSLLSLGALIGMVTAWLATRWRNPLVQAGLGLGVGLASLLVGWSWLDPGPHAQILGLSIAGMGASLGIVTGALVHYLESLSEAASSRLLHIAGLAGLLTPVGTVLIILAFTVLGLGLAPLFAPPPDPLAFESFPPSLGVMLFGIVAGLTGIALAFPVGILTGMLMVLQGAPKRPWVQITLGVGVGLLVGPVVSLIVTLAPIGIGGLSRFFWPILAMMVGGLAGLIAGRLIHPQETFVPRRVTPVAGMAAVGFILAHVFFWLSPRLAQFGASALVTTPTAAPPTLAVTATPSLPFFDLSELVVIEPTNASRLTLVAQLETGRNGLVWSPDGELLVMTAGNEIVLYEALTLTSIRSIRTDSAELSSLAVAPDSLTIAAGDSSGAVHVLEIGGTPLRVLPHHSIWVMSVAFSPDGRWLASASADDRVIVSDVTGGNEHFFSVPGQNEPAFAFSPDSGLFATLGDDGVLTLWDTHGWVEVRALQIGHSGRRLSFSPDGRWLAIGSNDGTVTVWDTLSWIERQTLNGHTGGVWALVFSPDGRLLASGSADHTVRVWDMASGAELMALGGHASDVVQVAFSRNGRALASTANVVLVWGVRE